MHETSRYSKKIVTVKAQREERFHKKIGKSNVGRLLFQGSYGCEPCECKRSQLLQLQIPAQYLQIHA